ncbi:MAG: hypothetical protein ACM3Y8_00240 [Byssovorax cruenta]
MTTRIPSRPIYIVGFLLLAFLCYQAHQLTRHLVGAALCGGLGTMTFAVTIPKETCTLPILVTLSGPILTYGLAWSGMFLLRSSKYRLLAYALIFASFAHLRFIQTLTGRGDELVLAQQWFGITSRPVVAVLVFLIGLPPVIAAYRVIANQHRMRVFLSSWLLPLAVLLLLLVSNERLYGPNGDQIQSALVFGIPVVVFVIDLLAIALLIVILTRYLPRAEKTQR